MLLMLQGEDGGESGDDEEEEDGFFVPHGYLSDSEGDHSGDEDMQGQDNHVRRRKCWLVMYLIYKKIPNLQ